MASKTLSSVFQIKKFCIRVEWRTETFEIWHEWRIYTVYYVSLEYIIPHTISTTSREGGAGWCVFVGLFFLFSVYLCCIRVTQNTKFSSASLSDAVKRKFYSRITYPFPVIVVAHFRYSRRRRWNLRLLYDFIIFYIGKFVLPLPLRCVKILLRFNHPQPKFSFVISFSDFIWLRIVCFIFALA